MLFRLPLMRTFAALMLAALSVLLPLTAAAQVVYHRCNDADPEVLDAHKTSVVSEAQIHLSLRGVTMSRDPSLTQLAQTVR